MRALLAAAAAFLIIALAGLWWVKFERQPPLVTFDAEHPVVGGNATWDVVVRGSGPGLRQIDVRLTAGGQTHALFSETIPPSGWRGSGVTERRLHVEADLRTLGVPEGPAQVEVFADTYAWHLVEPRSGAIASQTVTIDLTAPPLELLTTQHNLRLGGVAVALFRVGEDTERAGVAVGDYYFPATRGYFADPGIALALFAVPQDLSVDARPVVRVADAVGNTREAALPIRIKGRVFPERSLNIDDAFLQRKMPDIYAANGLTLPSDLVAAYLAVNRDLRRESEKQLRAATEKSAPAPLWDGVFRRQSNAAPMSAFADRRSYVHDGTVIDRQTHLGYDLASLLRAPVEATQRGTVVLAGNLGIYGNTVVLDHGLGVSSLYGHLSTIAVKMGQEVQAGETLGQTGETGLAGGDHLHFSILVHGVHVDPVEWWDPKWMREHVTAMLNMYPAAAPVAAAAAPAAPDAPADGAAPREGDGEARP